MFKVFNKNRPGAICAIDIGAEYVKAILFDKEEDKGHVMGIAEIRQKHEDINYGAIINISSVIENCNNAIIQAEREANMRAEQLILGIGGDIIKGKTVSLNYKRSKPKEKINQSELKNIIHKVQWKTFDIVRKSISDETGYPEIDLKLVNAAILDIKIDNYKVSNPIGFQGKEINISIFNAFAPYIHYGTLETITAELNDLKLLSIISEPYALSKSLSTEEEGSYSAIFIDIGGSSTNISIVKDNCLVNTKMFAIGGRTFTKRISAELNISYDEAEKIKIAYSKEELDKNSSSVIRKTIDNDIETWISGIELSLSEFDDLPFKILVSGGGSFLPEIMQILNQRSWTKNISFNRPPIIKYMQPKDISNMLDHTGKLTDRNFIIPLALGNAAINIIDSDKELTSTLKKVIGIIKA